MDSLIPEKDNSCVSPSLGCLEETTWDLNPLCSVELSGSSRHPHQRWTAGHSVNMWCCSWSSRDSNSMKIDLYRIAVTWRPTTQSHDDRVTSSPTLTKVSKRHRKLHRTRWIQRGILDFIYNNSCSQTLYINMEEVCSLTTWQFYLDTLWRVNFTNQHTSIGTLFFSPCVFYMVKFLAMFLCSFMGATWFKITTFYSLHNIAL